MKKFIILIPVYNDWKSVFKLLDNIDLQIKDWDAEVSVLIVNVEFWLRKSALYNSNFNAKFFTSEPFLKNLPTSISEDWVLEPYNFVSVDPVKTVIQYFPLFKTCKFW